MNIENVDFKTATIVDVRTLGEFSGGSVKGSINIPLDEIPERIEEFRQMSGNIIVCCASGNRSGQATMFLQHNGISNVYNGGGWEEVVERI